MGSFTGNVKFDFPCNFSRDSLKLIRYLGFYSAKNPRKNLYFKDNIYFIMKSGAQMSAQQNLTTAYK